MSFQGGWWQGSGSGWQMGKGGGDHYDTWAGWVYVAWVWRPALCCSLLVFSFLLSVGKGELLESDEAELVRAHGARYVAPVLSAVCLSPRPWPAAVTHPHRAGGGCSPSKTWPTVFSKLGKLRSATFRDDPCFSPLPTCQPWVLSGTGEERMGTIVTGGGDSECYCPTEATAAKSS